MDDRRRSLKACQAALRRLGAIPVAVMVALAPGIRAAGPPVSISRPVRHMLQVGRNEALERRLRWSRIRLESAALAGGQDLVSLRGV
jgi:hypothetical protein